MPIYTEVPEGSAYTTSKDYDGTTLTVSVPGYRWIVFYDERTGKSWRKYGRQATYRCATAEDMDYVSFSVRTPSGKPTVSLGKKASLIYPSKDTLEMEIAKWSQIGSSLEVTVSADVDSDKTEVRLTSLGMPYCSMSGRVVSGQALFENVTAGMCWKCG